MRRLAEDPLVHFLAVGAVLFAVLVLGGSDEEAAPARIHIDAVAVRETLEAATLLQGREPTAAELRQLVDPLVEEEVLYREALALGLDENDDEVRRRLVEKMRYLTEDLADPEPASEAELRAFFESRPDLFRIPERVTFDQVFFSPRQRGEALEADVGAAFEALADGADPAAFGDSTPLRSRFVDAPREQVRVLFGTELEDAVFAAEPGAWIGPYESDFGLHLVRLVEHEAPRLPAFDEVEDAARERFAAERREEANARALAEMRARYTIDVDWPEGLDPGAAR